MKFKSINIFVALIISACNISPEQGEKSMVETENKTMISFNDPHSYAKADEVAITHLNWIAKVDFEKKIITATANYKIDNKSGANQIIFDTKNLEILSVSRNESNEKIDFNLGESDRNLGRALTIPITEDTRDISIRYKTTEGADALQFLDPAQTAGKKHPFLFTQSQAILARTWIPIQDSPGIRFTYEAEVQVPKGMLALMSAENPTEVNPNGIYKFKMDQPIPSYLMALAVGNINYEKLGRNTGVYAEPELLKDAAYEFADMQNMLDTAEALYGDYRWGRYEVIVLPPSFPFGGMENPRLTFATPTIIAGDRSLTALIAHELAHSWSGNLVTNANWEDIWLNEGFTVYFENRIMEEIYGKDFANMLAILSLQDLKEEMEWLKSEDRWADTRLKVDLENRDPDDGLTGVPYDKGFYLLKLIEETVGRERFDNFLNQYFNEFAFQVMTTDKFLNYINQELLSKNEVWKNEINIDKWVFEPGLPENVPNYSSTKFRKVDEELANWTKGASAGELNTSDWVTPQWLHFVRKLPDSLSKRQLIDLDEAFGFSTIGNSEIQAAWLTKVLPLDYAKADEAAKEFLMRVGRRKFLVPIYKAILKKENGAEQAKAIYEKARANYHAVSRETLDDLILEG